MKKIYYYILFIKYIFAIPLFFRILKKSELFEELNLYRKGHKCEYSHLLSMVWLFECYPEYRNVVYARQSDIYVKCLSKTYKGLSSLYLQVKPSCIGKNLMIWHGFSSIVNAEKIGDNCSIWQQVTIGNKLDNGESKPIIGNNVKICAGAIIVGNVVIGDNVVIGAGSVVVKNVPSNCIIAGVPARIIKS